MPADQERDADQQPCHQADVAQPAGDAEDPGQLGRVDLDVLVCRRARALGATVASQPAADHRQPTPNRGRTAAGAPIGSTASVPFSSAATARAPRGPPAAPTIGSAGSSRRVGMEDERPRLRAAEAAVEGDQLLERAALVELGVVEAADHDVGDVLEAVGAKQVLRRGRREGRQRVLALEPRRRRDGARRRPPATSGPRSDERTSSQPTCGCSRRAPISCGWRSSISSSVSRRRSSIR